MRGRLCHILNFVVGKCFWHFARPAIFDSQLLYQNRDFCLYPTCIQRPSKGGFRRNIATPSGVEKLEWCGYPIVKNFEDMFIRFAMIHERDGRTDRQTPHHGIYRAYAYASRGKNYSHKFSPCICRIKSTVNLALNRSGSKNH